MGFAKILGLIKVQDGRTAHPLYKKWKGMMTIAYERENEQPVDSRWHDFWVFAHDVEPLMDKKGEKKIFCRLDCSKMWMKGNVHFVKTVRASLFGKVSTHKIVFNGRKVSTNFVHKLLKKQGINLNLQTIRDRVRNGQDPYSENKQFKNFKDPVTGRFLPKSK